MHVASDFMCLIDQESKQIHCYELYLPALFVLHLHHIYTWKSFRENEKIVRDPQEIRLKGLKNRYKNRLFIF